MLENPGVMQEVHRIEANTKFFRSFSLVLIILGIWAGFKHWPLGTNLLILGLLLMSLYRYAEQRLKATNQVYWYIITAESRLANGFRKSKKLTGSMTHAGGVVFRWVKDKGGKKLEYLLVQASASPTEWVLPKGHIMPSERMEETAVREVREETGVWARVWYELGGYDFNDKHGIRADVRIYLMEKETEGQPDNEHREHVWLPFEEAIQKVRFEESRALLKLTNEKSARRMERWRSVIRASLSPDRATDRRRSRYLRYGSMSDRF
jgi:8-oxo-dGTP pyrophosphatase MutT (NUDIX family)